jgi:hypothetical protein
VNKEELRQLGQERILDAKALLAARRWSGAYYLAGYAVECALKACVLGFVEKTGVIFEDRKYAERCCTHDLEDLPQLADGIKDRERRFPHLYVVSDEITDDNRDVAYGEVVRLLGQMRDPYPEFFRVKVRGVDDPLAKAALDTQGRYRGDVPIRLYDTYFGRVGAEEVYIYPMPVPDPVS